MLVKCKKCLKILNGNDFYEDKRAKNGIQSDCKACVKERARKWRKNNADRKAKLDKEYAERNKEKIRAYQKKYREKNKEKAREYHKKYSKRNEHILKVNRKKYNSRPDVKDRRNARNIIRMKEDPKFKLTCQMRSYISKSLSKKSYGALRHVDWNIEELKSHIEKQFTKGMTWDNYGEWHIDHIIPVANFIYEKPEDDDFKSCWCLSNLRPIWAKENLSKQDALLFLI